MEGLKNRSRHEKLDEEAPHEVMLTIDASTGCDAVSRAKLFHEAVSNRYCPDQAGTVRRGGVIFLGS